MTEAARYINAVFGHFEPIMQQMFRPPYWIKVRTALRTSQLHFLERTLQHISLLQEKSITIFLKGIWAATEIPVSRGAHLRETEERDTPMARIFGDEISISQVAASCAPRPSSLRASLVSACAWPPWRRRPRLVLTSVSNVGERAFSGKIGFEGAFTDRRVRPRSATFLLRVPHLAKLGSCRGFHS